MPGRPVPEPVVLHVLEAVAFGSGRHLLDLVRHTSGVVHHVVLSEGRPGEPSNDGIMAELEASGAATTVLPMRRLPAHPANLAAVWRLARLLRTLRPALVHAHASIAGALVRPAARIAGTPSVWTPNGVRTDRPTVAIERQLARITELTIAVSPSEAELMVRLGVAREGHLVTIPNGIDVHAEGLRARDTVRAQLGVPRDARVVGFIGRLSAQKAPLDFVAAAAEVLRRQPDAHAVMIGSGPLEEQVDRALVNLSSRRFRRLVVDSGAGALLPAFDVLVLSSRYEGGPYTPLEAMRAGVPVVTTDCVGSRDVVVHGESGLVVPVGDRRALAEAVLTVLRDRRRADQLVSNATMRLRQVFDVRLMGHATSVAYRDVLARAGSALEDEESAPRGRR